MKDSSEVQGFVLRRARVTAEELTGLLTEQISFGEQAWLLVQSVSREGFGALSPSEAAAIATTWPQGRIFGHRCEARWKKNLRSATYDVLILSEDPDLCLDGFQPPASGWRVEKADPRAAIKAWGSSIPDQVNVRAESRLPVRFTYPENCAEGRLECFYYHAPLGGVQFIRLVGVR